MDDCLHFVEIEHLADKWLSPWLDLYETAFPASERVLVSAQLEIVRAHQIGASLDDHLLTVTDASGAFVGLIQYQQISDLRLTLLSYMAVMPTSRGRGLGSRFYAEVLARARSDGSVLLLLEVERPDQAESDVNRRWAERRIEFYRRLGARMLEGIHYEQVVGWHQPPLPMHLMAHALAPLDDRQVFEKVHQIFGSQIIQVGPLRLG